MLVQIVQVHGACIILVQSSLNIFLLDLVVALLLLSLQRLLADVINLIFEVLNHLAVLLLTENVVLLLCRLCLLQLLCLVVGIHVNDKVLFIEEGPVKGSHLKCYSSQKEIIEHLNSGNGGKVVTYSGPCPAGCRIACVVCALR